MKIGFLFAYYVCIIGVACEKVDVKKSIVWGPGLTDPKFNLPVRYFYIQAVNKNSKNLTKSIGNDPFVVNIIDIATNQRPRVYLQQLDRHDGSYIVRYRLYNPHSGLKVSITYKDEHVAQSPYIMNGFIQNDDCFCPEENLSEWFEALNCNETYTQIEKDLSKFKAVNMSKTYTTIVNKFNQRYSQSLCHYAIIDNQVYRKCFGEHVGFNMFSDAILLSLARKVKLPDVEFFMNLGDWPLASKRDRFLPIVSWCGSEDSHDLLLPTYDLTESTLEMLGRQSLDIFAVQASTGPKWSNKTEKAFWRGRDSRQERLDLVLLSKKYPLMLDAALTNMFFFREKEHLEKYGPISQRVSFFDFFKYKYQINIDGTVAAYRLPYLMIADSVVLKQESIYYEHFYADLKPNFHYIPFEQDLSDLLDKIEWAMKNDEKAEKIARNARDYTREYLQPNHIFCYHAKFLQKYSQKLKSRVKLRDGMEHVKQATSASECKCPKKRNQASKNEL